MSPGRVKGLGFGGELMSPRRVKGLGFGGEFMSPGVLGRVTSPV